MKPTLNSSFSNQAIILQGAIERSQELEADELGFYVALKRGGKFIPQVCLISSVVITPVGYRCNLNCDYCFNRTAKDEFSKSEVMTDDVLEKTVREIACLPGNVEFIWHGGEPLLAGINFYQKALSLQRKYGLSNTRNAIQTNGTLLNQNWAAFLKQHNFKVGISLDGPKEIHNSLRKSRSNNGTFDRVIKGIESLINHNKSFGIVAIINENNSYSPKEFLDFFIRNRIYVLSVNPRLNDSNFSSRFFADFICSLFDAWLASDELNLRITFFEELIKAFQELPHNICCLNGNCSKIIQIDQRGNIWPCCDRYLPFKQYKLGNIEHNSLEEILTRKPYTDFKEYYSKLPPQCIDCRWNHLCKGGCPYNRLVAGQGEDGGDPLCSAYKQIFQHVFTKYQEISRQVING